MRQILAEPRAVLIHADALEVLQRLRADSVDALVTDPPAGIGFMGKGWDSDKGGRDQWVAWLAGVMSEVLRVLKPGAHGLVWALPRTSHWTATALENAGFEVRDVVMHLFGTGFPKSLDVSKAMDAAAGAERAKTPTVPMITGSEVGAISKNLRCAVCGKARASGNPCVCPRLEDIPITDAAKQWEGWGTALKPAAEHWVLVRKPLAGTVAANVLAHGTGALNIDACRIGMSDEDRERARVPQPAMGAGEGQRAYELAIAGRNGQTFEPAPAGRFPAHLVLDPEAAALLDAQSGTLKNGGQNETADPAHTSVALEGGITRKGTARAGDSGGASRFFYVAKPSTAERDAGCEHLPAKSGGEATDREDGSAGVANPRAGAGRGGGRRNFHPTVKPVALMRWLCRLITPPGGVVLDPFTGSGTTGVAALAEGFKFAGVEGNEEYVEIVKARLLAALKEAAP